jgi:RNA polymerase sigma-70 factor (ECF subfamily)
MRKGHLVQLFPQASEEQISDAGLVAACAAGDRAARGLLVERHVDAVRRFVARMQASDPCDVNDLVQVTFESALAGARRFRGSSARGWLYGIAANVVREHARREIRRKRALVAVRETVDASTAASDALATARLPAILAALPHDLRAALVLVDLEGERGSDAAAALGIPEGTLWRRVFHARQAVRRAIGEDS